MICPVSRQATDSRLLRAKGVSCFGFSPMPNSPILLHEHDEYLHRDVFLDGIRVYTELISSLANAERFADEEL